MSKVKCIIFWPNRALFLNSSWWQQVTWLKTWFRWKIGWTLLLLCCYSSVTFPNSLIFFFWKKAAQRMSCRLWKNLRDLSGVSVALSEKSYRGCTRPPPSYPHNHSCISYLVALINYINPRQCTGKDCMLSLFNTHNVRSLYAFLT